MTETKRTPVLISCSHGFAPNAARVRERARGLVVDGLDRALDQYEITPRRAGLILDPRQSIRSAGAQLSQPLTYRIQPATKGK
jgi:hypothetical protein